MKRSDFLKKLTIAAGVAVTTPMMLSSTGKKEISAEEASGVLGELPALAIDFESITKFTLGGKEISAWDILQIYKETGMLIYRSSYKGQTLNPPMIISGNPKNAVFVDYTKLK